MYRCFLLLLVQQLLGSNGVLLCLLDSLLQIALHLQESTTSMSFASNLAQSVYHAHDLATGTKKLLILAEGISALLDRATNDPGNSDSHFQSAYR